VQPVKVSQQKRSDWLLVVFGVLILMAAGILSLPMVTTLLQRQFPADTGLTSSSSLDSEAQEELALQAKSYELVLQRDPDNVAAWEELLGIRLQQQDLEGAIASLAQLAQLRPNEPDYQILLAQAQQQVEDYESAAATYRNLLASNPTNSKALQGMVNLLLQQNRPEAAIGLLQDTLETIAQENTVQPEQGQIVPIQLLLGQVYAAEERFEDAIAVYNQAIETDPEDFRPVLAKALVLQKQGKIEESQPLLTTAVSLAPARYKDQIEAMATPTEATSEAPTATTP
jgi:tetratricopeptide (TPR) repeat protein